MSTGPATPLPSVSVAMATRNGARYVADQVRSILAQRPAPIELIVGDDDSTDDTLAIIEREVADARATSPEVETELTVRRHRPALGVTANFEDALLACRGDLIALSDHDDVWQVGKLARVAARFADDHRLQLVHTDARLVDSDGQQLGLSLLEALQITVQEKVDLVAGDAAAALLRRNLVTGATVVLRRELVEKAAPFPAEWVHDEWLAAIAAGLDPATGAVRLLPEPLIDYRQHDANEIGARKPTMADRWAKLTEPRDERAPRLALRTQQLADRLDALGAPERRVTAARAKHAHEAARAQMPANRLARIPSILSGAVSGRYSRYSRGAIDVLRDLLQPASGRPS